METASHNQLNEPKIRLASHPGQVTNKPLVNTSVIDDSNLKNIKMSDLTKICRVKTIREANLDLMRN